MIQRVEVQPMKVYVLSVSAGVLMGIIYGLVGVKSPAPPLIALCGLLGMLVGEQVVPVARRVLRGMPVTSSWLAGECVPHITGVAPPPDVLADPTAKLPTSASTR
jgi:XapX domain-containing protein